MKQQTRRRPLHMRLALSTAGMVVLLATAACGNSSDNDAGGSSADLKEAPAAESIPDGAARQADGTDFENNRSVLSHVDGRESKNQSNAQAVAVISTGTVSLESDDVGDARFQVQKIVSRHRGTISQEETTTGDDGKTATSRMVL